MVYVLKNYPMNVVLFTFIVVFIADIVAGRRTSCRKPGRLTENDVVSALLKDYNKSLPDIDGPVIVKVELHVQDVSSLNELTGDFLLDILFTQLWHDPALSFQNYSTCKSNITIDAISLDKIWKPNTCLVNSKSTMIHKSPSNNTMFILYSDGTIWINYRMQVKAPCNLKLHSFPFDSQECSLVFESYSFNSDEVKLEWFEDPAITLMKKNMELPDFKLIAWSATNSTLPYPNGNWDRLEVTFIFRRRYGFFILQAYVPTYLTIIVSWVSFSMNTELKALPARSTVGVSSLVALTYQFGNILQNLPKVSYMKALDVWMLGCIFFVFGSVLELALVCFLTKSFGEPRKITHIHRNSLPVPMFYRNNVSYLGTDFVNPRFPSQSSLLLSNFTRKSQPSSNTKQFCKHWFNSDQIDQASTLLFPLSFTVFNIFYWSYFLGQARLIEDELLTENHHIVSQ